MGRIVPRLSIAKRRNWEDRLVKRLEAVEKAREEYYKEVFRATEDGMSLADIGYAVGISQSSIGKYRDTGRDLLTPPAGKSAE